MRLLLLRHIILLPCHHHKIQGYNLIGPIQWPEIDLNSSSSNCAAERKLVNMKPCARTEHKSNSFYWPDLIHAPQWQPPAGQEENAICLNGRVIKLNTLCFIIITVRLGWEEEQQENSHSLGPHCGNYFGSIARASHYNHLACIL